MNGASHTTDLSFLAVITVKQEIHNVMNVPYYIYVEKGRSACERKGKVRPTNTERGILVNRMPLYSFNSHLLDRYRLLVHLQFRCLLRLRLQHRPPVLPVHLVL